MPLKAEHGIFLEKVLFPMHTSKALTVFQPQVGINCTRHALVIAHGYVVAPAELLRDPIRRQRSIMGRTHHQKYDLCTVLHV